MLRECAQSLLMILETINMHQPGWSQLTTHYSEGTLIVTKLGEFSFVTIADVSLNEAFAMVAIRMAKVKVLKWLEQRMAGLSSSQNFGSSGLSYSSPRVEASSDLKNSGFGNSGLISAPPGAMSGGLSWSGVGGASSVGGRSTVAVADEKSVKFLEKCTKLLCRYIGPSGKVFVKRAARKVAGGGAFSLDLAEPLLQRLSGQIDDPASKERVSYQSQKLTVLDD